MNRIRVIGLAVVAAFAFSAVASATASAALPEFSASTTFTSEGGKGTLKTKNSTVECTTNTSEGGTVTAPKSASAKAVIFKGCKSAGVECKTSGAAKEEIKTTELVGTLGYLEAATKKVGIELKPKVGELFAEFKCSIITVKVTGCTIGQLTPVNTLTENFELAWKENAGKNGQEWTKLEGGAACTLKAFGETSWLAQTTKLKSAAKIEVKA